MKQSKHLVTKFLLKTVLEYIQSFMLKDLFQCNYHFLKMYFNVVKKNYYTSCDTVGGSDW